MDLFEAVSKSDAGAPLAERLRPKSLDDYRGQANVRKVLAPFLDKPDQLPNIILWGPPGSGKTTLARIIAEHSGMHFINLNAVETGAKEIRALGDQAHERKIQGFGRTLIFIDEIHRLNKGQQDVLLPFTEAGDFILIGATTENPSYELNSALLSRSRVIVLNRLGIEDLKQIFERGVRVLGLESKSFLTPEGLESLLEFSDGDARKMLTAIDTLAAHHQVRPEPLTREDLSEILQKPALRYDKKSDEHYDTISAFIKSVREVTLTPQFIIWRACSREERTQSLLPVAW